MVSNLILLSFVVAIGINISEARNIGRVIGGSDAPEHKYPYQVSFRLKNFFGKDVHFCSGSILNERWLLTAAHCVTLPGINKAVAVAGTNYLNEHGDEYAIEFGVIHESYTNFYHDDIALVKVAEKIRFNAHVSPISLPARNYDQDDFPAVFSGWGSTEVWGDAPNELQEIKLKLVSYNTCKPSQKAITENHICSYTQRGEGVCHGDSGGPLVADGHQVGIASYVVPCAVGFPDVYTRVYKYINWINSTQEKYQ